MRFPRKRGAQSVMVRVFIPDNSVATGAGLAGLLYSSTNLVIAFSRELDNGFTAYTGANIEDISTIGTYQAPSSSSKVRFKAVDATYGIGLYEIHFHNSATAFGAGDASRHVIINVLETTTSALKIGPNMVLIPLSGFDVSEGESNPIGSSTTTLTLQKLAVVQVSGGGDAVVITGGAASGATPAGHGIKATGGAASTTTGGIAGCGIHSLGGGGAASTNRAGVGFSSLAGADNGAGGNDGMDAYGTGDGDGFYGEGGPTGHGLHAIGADFEDSIFGSVNDATPTASGFSGDSSLEGTIDDFYAGCVLVFRGGALKGISRRVTTSTASTRGFTFAVPYPAAPADTDPFEILGRID